MASSSAPTTSHDVAPKLLPLDPEVFKGNRDKYLDLLGNSTAGHVTAVHAPPLSCVHDSDRELVYRPESNFFHLTGCELPECILVIDHATRKTVLLVPRLPESYAVWVGEIEKPEELRARYGVDAVRYTDELDETLKGFDCDALHVLDGVNSDSGSRVASLPDADEVAARIGARIERGEAYPALAEARVFKTDAELRVLRWVNKVSSSAHVAVMQSVRPGMAEFQLESRFLHEVYSKGGCRFTAYTCICGAGKSAAKLHYPDNDKVIKDGDMCLLDMGGEYRTYCSDITTSYPANGKFTDKQRGVYEAVLAANRAVLHACKPGVSWTEMHDLSYTVLAEHLLSLGILKGATARELVDKDVLAVFQPHGLGHFMGHDVHDVGGYGTYKDGTCSKTGDKIPERSARPGFRSLRTSRVLCEGMVITIEPGLYRIPALLEGAFADPNVGPHIDREKLDEWMGDGFGGIRIEDDVIITADGCENMSIVPRTVEEIEQVMAGGEWKVW